MKLEEKIKKREQKRKREEQREAAEKMGIPYEPTEEELIDEYHEFLEYHPECDKTYLEWYFEETEYWL